MTKIFDINTVKIILSMLITAACAITGYAYATGAATAARTAEMHTLKTRVEEIDSRGSSGLARHELEQQKCYGEIMAKLGIIENDVKWIKARTGSVGFIPSGGRTNAQ